MRLMMNLSISDHFPIVCCLNLDGAALRVWFMNFLFVIIMFINASLV